MNPMMQPPPEDKDQATPAPASSPWYSFMTNDQVLAQFGHFFGALSIVYIVSTFFGQSGMWWTFGVGLVYALLKEFVFDILVEKDTWPDSLMDFAFLVLGGLVAIGFFYLGVRVGRLAL